MNNDVFVHANGLIERFKQNAETAAAQGEWTAAQTWYNAVSVVQEPETNAEILKQYPTAKLPTAVEFKHIAQGKWIWRPDKRWWECDQCGERTTDACMGKPRANYCPWCGADMRKEADDAKV